MQIPTIGKLVLMSGLAVLGSGCSFAFVNGPPRGHESLSAFSCTESAVLPVIDGAWAGLWGVLALVALASDHNSESEQAARGLTILVGGGAAGLWGVSAATGATRVGRCRAARSELARRSQEALERTRLVAVADSASGNSSTAHILVGR